MKKLCLSMALLAGAGAMLLADSASAANPACQWYVQQSSRQQKENLDKNCGFRGPEWTTDAKLLIAYCETNAPEVWKGLAARREQMLAGCKRK
jgi:hypothetical protein